MSKRSPAGADPVRDEDRLQEIADLHLTDTREDPELVAIARGAAESLHLPIGIVSIVLDDAQYFVAAHGLEGWVARVRGTPVEWSFCANAVRSGEPFVVEDARSHPAVKDSPMVEVQGIGCYAGIPLRTSRGQVLGTLCVAGTERRAFRPEDISALRALAERALARIEERRTT
ncbi:MAG TPA: GAF domain-containing protein [Vicinamibacteria bacterium]|nr:GAF domain-containing protein [Vicinamibacteria bacterium]